MGTWARRVLATLVLALAVGSGLGGWLLFNSTSGRTAPSYSNRGYITVLTDDPAAVVELRQRVVLDPDYPPNAHRLLDVDVTIQRSADTEFSWAVVAGGGVALACRSGNDCLK